MGIIESTFKDHAAAVSKGEAINNNYYNNNNNNSGHNKKALSITGNKNQFRNGSKAGRNLPAMVVEYVKYPTSSSSSRTNNDRTLSRETKGEFKTDLTDFSRLSETVNPLYEYRRLMWPTMDEQDFISYYTSDLKSDGYLMGNFYRQNQLDCNYTCHQQCSGMVTLNCKAQAAETGGQQQEEENYEMKFEEPELEYSDATLRGENLRYKIEKFNLKSEDSQLELQDDGVTFHGFIRVNMNLSRPINVLAGTRPPSIYDIIYDEEEYAEKTLTSFYLPRDTVKAIHVTSDTTAQELISALLKKFKVVDNPRKFRLYDKSWSGDGTMKGVLRRIQNHEKPLWLVMAWDDDPTVNHKLVLQENEIGDILWDAFTFPELNNFLKILDREEDEYVSQVQKKYKYMQDKLRKALDRLKAPPADEPFTDM